MESVTKETKRKKILQIRIRISDTKSKTVAERMCKFKSSFLGKAKKWIKTLEIWWKKRKKLLKIRNEKVIATCMEESKRDESMQLFVHTCDFIFLLNSKYQNWAKE